MSINRDDVRVYSLSEGEYRQAVQATLARHGISYEQLAAQARCGQFTPPSLGGLWTLIHGTVGENARQSA